MELRHLRYFIAVAEALSFTKGAEKLRLAQPSLTRQIKGLEEELGVRLLERTRAHVRLTPEGQSFLTDAKRVLTLSEGIVDSVRHFSRHDLTHAQHWLRREFVLRSPAGHPGLVPAFVPRRAD